MQERQRFQARRRALPFVLAVLGAVIALNAAGSRTYDVSAVQLRLGARVATPGFTRIALPPIGQITAATHSTPLQLTLGLQSIDMETLRSLVDNPSQGLGERLVEEISNEAQLVMRSFAGKLVLLASLGGFLGVLVLRRRSAASLLYGSLVGMLLCALLLGVTYVSFDIQAFEEPEYQGVIEAAPWMINLLEESLVKVEELGIQLQTLAVNLYAAFEQIEDFQTVGLPDFDLTVLHVSDIHNNPAAYDFARQVIASFPVSFVVDTGDLTDWGTPLEAEIVSRIEALDITYVFTSGNHDAPDVLQRLAQTENVRLIDNGEVEVKGLRIGGIGDAAAGSYSPEPASLEELASTAEFINEKYGLMTETPNIFGVHNHRIAAAIEPGLFPVVLLGHSHVLSVERRGGTVYINAGTTGASGVRGLQSKQPIPFSLALLYFAETDGTFELVAVDGISVQGIEASFSLERTFVHHRRRNQADDVEVPLNVFD